MDHKNLKGLMNEHSVAPFAEALESDDRDIRVAAARSITDRDAIRRVVLENPDAFVRRELIAKIDDQQLLKTLANDVDGDVRACAVERINDKVFLQKKALWAEKEGFVLKAISERIKKL